MKNDDEHPDDLGAGLQLRCKTLSTKTVRRATSPNQVLAVCLAHNLRQGNEDHRHRSRIDPLRTPLNQVLRGSGCPDVAARLALNSLEELSIVPRRLDAIMAIELVFQPPAGADAPAFWSECLSWADGRYEHIISAVVHRDQARPHMHVLALAVTGNRLAGNALTSGENRFIRQRREFMAHMRDNLGLRPDRKPRRTKSFTDIMTSPGKGPRTHAEAARRDANVARQLVAKNCGAKVGMGVDGHGDSRLAESNPHAQPNAPTPLLRSFSDVLATFSEGVSVGLFPATAQRAVTVAPRPGVAGPGGAIREVASIAP